MTEIFSKKTSLLILIGAALMLSLSMGLRQSLGIFVQPAVQDLPITLAQFTLALAVQNLAWGIFQPITGALAVKYGFQRIMMTGAVLYLIGLMILAFAQGAVTVMLGAGILIGLALACTASGIALAVASRPVSTATRSKVLGMVSAAGSLGAMFAAPLGQLVTEAFTWREGVLSFFVLALIMIPAVLAAGRVDRIPLSPSTAGDVSAKMALGKAFRNLPFVVMAAAYFVCGLQLVFITTHLPSYLVICGLDPMLSAKALGIIGAFNVLGSLFFGWAGGRWSKGVLLGLIYTLRSIAIGVYFAVPPSPTSTLVFAAIMGFLWLGVAPLVAGAVIETFGLKWQAMLTGIMFLSHQVGSFVGALGGGILFEASGSYDLAWRLGTSMGLMAGIIQIAVALLTDPKTGGGISRKQIHEPASP